MRRIGWMAAALALAAPCCNSDINDQTVRIAVTSRVSLNTAGEANNQACERVAVSADGRYVAFVSTATNLSTVPTNGIAQQVFVRDLLLGTTEMVSVNDGGVSGNGNSRNPSISADGSRVVFSSSASNLVPGDTSGTDMFLRDRVLQLTTRVSEAEFGGEPDGPSAEGMISGNGLFVVFQSTATDVVSAASGGSHVFRRDLTLLITELVSVDPFGDEADGPSDMASISFDGNRIAFSSTATSLTPDPDSSVRDVFVRDMGAATTVRITFAHNPPALPNGDSTDPFISGDGTQVAFISRAANLIVSDLNGTTADVFARAVSGGAIVLVSRHSAGPQGTRRSGMPVLSHTGRYAAFYSDAPNLVDDDDNDRLDAFWVDLVAGKTLRLSVSTGGIGGNLESGDFAERPALTGDGRTSFFRSFASNLISLDINGQTDIFGRGPLH